MTEAAALEGGFKAFSKTGQERRSRFHKVSGDVSKRLTRMTPTALQVNTWSCAACSG